MAQIHTETVVITFNQLVKAGMKPDSAITEEVQLALEQVAQELAGPGVIVEVEKA